jgi:hypothetical protein
MTTPNSLAQTIKPSMAFSVKEIVAPVLTSGRRNLDIDNVVEARDGKWVDNPDLGNVEKLVSPS